MSERAPVDRRHVKTSDADREAVAERLREAHVVGRLTEDELDERLNGALSARTFGDLEPLVRDLPPASSDGSRAMRPSVPPAPPRPASNRTVRSMRVGWMAWFIAVSINLVIWLIVSLTSGHLVYFWPMWVAGPWGAVLLGTELFRRAGRDQR